MSLRLNQFTVAGNLTKDPELRTLDSGTRVCTGSIAYNEKGSDGVERTSFFKFECWQKQADNTAKYLTKGDPVILCGKLLQKRWEKDGQKQSMIVLSCQHVHFLPKYKATADGDGEEFKDPF